MILAIDTSLGAVSACVFDAVRDECLAEEKLVLDRGHAEALAPLLERVLAGSKCAFDNISRIATSIGPGSFTGIRIGLAAARALGLAWKVPVVGVSTFAAFAAPLVGRRPDMIVSAVDARHGRIYLQLFQNTGREMTGPKLASIQDAVRMIGAGPARLTGNAANLLAAACHAAGTNVEAFDSVSPDIMAIARVGAACDVYASPPKPLYLKAPDVTAAPISTANGR